MPMEPPDLKMELITVIKEQIESQNEISKLVIQRLTFSEEMAMALLERAEAILLKIVKIKNRPTIRVEPDSSDSN